MSVYCNRNACHRRRKRRPTTNSYRIGCRCMTAFWTISDANDPPSAPNTDTVWVNHSSHTASTARGLRPVRLFRDVNSNTHNPVRYACHHWRIDGTRSRQESVVGTPFFMSVSTPSSQLYGVCTNAIHGQCVVCWFTNCTLLTSRWCVKEQQGHGYRTTVLLLHSDHGRRARLVLWDHQQFRSAVGPTSQRMWFGGRQVHQCPETAPVDAALCGAWVCQSVAVSLVRVEIETDTVSGTVLRESAMRAAGAHTTKSEVVGATSAPPDTHPHRMASRFCPPAAARRPRRGK